MTIFDELERLWRKWTWRRHARASRRRYEQQLALRAIEQYALLAHAEMIIRAEHQRISSERMYDPDVDGRWPQ